MKKYSEKKDQLMHIKSMLISEENKIIEYDKFANVEFFRTETLTM